MRPVTVDLSNVDWALLRKQKQALLETIRSIEKNDDSGKTKPLCGLVHLLDPVQDQAAETLGESVVFGKRRV